MRGTLRIFLAAGAASASACSLLTSLDGLSNPFVADASTPDAGVDGSVQDASNGDGGGKGDSAVLDARGTQRTWRKLAVTGPSARHSAKMVYDEARQKIVLFGGTASNANGMNDTWEWDGAAWSQRSANPVPAARMGFAMAYDGARHLALVYGGGGGGDALPWQWDGTNWTNPSFAGPFPSARNAVAMAYDSTRGVAVLYGGYDVPTRHYLGETWEWSASGIVKRTPAASPSKRGGHVMAYDSTRSRVVLFGGYDDSGPRLNDLWEYDGTTWTQQPAAVAPPVRTGACAAYDALRGVTVVVGGRGSNDADLGDVWEWDGTAWHVGASGPSARRTCAMAYDAARNVVVLFGGGNRVGSGSPATALDDTWVYE